MSFIPMPIPMPITELPVGALAFRRFSRNGTLTTTTSTIDASAATTLNFRTTATTVQVRSTSASDTLLGVGARSLVITGLAADFTSHTETVSLAGTGVVTSATTFIRVTSLAVATSGTYAGLPGVTPPTGANVGVITANYTGNAAVICTIATQAGREFNSFFTVPKGFYMALNLIITTVNINKTCNLDIYARGGANIVVAPFTASLLSASLVGLVGAASSSYNPPIIIPEYTDVYFLGSTTSGSGDISLTVAGYIAPNA